MESRNSLCCISFSILIAILSGCTTPGYDARFAACEAEAEKRYPVRYEERTVRRSREVEVPTGRVTCNTYVEPNGNSRTDCKEHMRYETQYYNATVSEDINSTDRWRFAATCTAEWCAKDFNNRSCTPEVKPARIAPTSPTEARVVLARYFGPSWVENPFGTYDLDLGFMCSEGGRDPLPLNEINGITVMRQGSTFVLQVRRMNWLLAWGPCGQLAYRISGQFTQWDIDQIIAALKGLGAKL